MNRLIPSLIFLMTSLALAQVRPRIFTELRAAMKEESASWTRSEIEEVGYEELQWRFVKTWDDAEVEIAAE